MQWHCMLCVFLLFFKGAVVFRRRGTRRGGALPRRWKLNRVDQDRTDVASALNLIQRKIDVSVVRIDSMYFPSPEGAGVVVVVVFAGTSNSIGW